MSIASLRLCLIPVTITSSTSSTSSSFASCATRKEIGNNSKSDNKYLFTGNPPKLTATPKVAVIVLFNELI